MRFGSQAEQRTGFGRSELNVGLKAVSMAYNRFGDAADCTDCQQDRSEYRNDRRYTAPYPRKQNEQ